jgi:hypothetical protein
MSNQCRTVSANVCRQLITGYAQHKLATLIMFRARKTPKSGKHSSMRNETARSPSNLSRHGNKHSYTVRGIQIIHPTMQHRKIKKP